MRELILAYQNAVAGEISRFEGHVAKFMGDGVLAYFGWPQAHEDSAERAVRTGLSIAQAVTKLQTPAKVALATRIGIATGVVVVGDLIGAGAAQEETVVGETPNLAARFQGLAQPGEVIISDSTRRLLGEVFELQALGSQTLKGIASAIEVYRVCAERTTESRYQAQRRGAVLPLFGHEHELAQIMEHWQRSIRGEGQMILLSGEAGIGKSRILQAVETTLDGQPHYRIHYQCSPYHSDSALYPAIQQLTRATQFTAEDTNEIKLDKLETLLDRGRPRLALAQPEQSASLIADLLGIDFESRYGTLDMTPARPSSIISAAMPGITRGQNQNQRLLAKPTPISQNLQSGSIR